MKSYYLERLFIASLSLLIGYCLILMISGWLKAGQSLPEPEPILKVEIDSTIEPAQKEPQHSSQVQAKERLPRNNAPVQSMVTSEVFEGLEQNMPELQAQFADFDTDQWSNRARIFSLSDVDSAPFLLSYVAPKLALFHPEGKVLLRLTVSEKGRVIKVEILENEASFSEQSLVIAAKKWRFKPAKIDHKTVSVYVDVPLIIKESGTRQ